MSFGEDRIIRKSPEEIEKMRRSGKMVRQVLDHLKTVVAAGVTTMDLEKAAEKLIAELGAAPGVHVTRILRGGVVRSTPQRAFPTARC